MSIDPVISSRPSRVGTVLDGKYRLDAELGRGGMGTVYRAHHLRVHKTFAVKVLLPELVSHRSVTSRFLREAQAAGRIGHPGILDVYDVGEAEDKTPFIVMELLTGEPLNTVVRRERLDVDAACWIALEILDILDAAHRAGIVHRDVKPQNVFLTSQEGPAPTTTRRVKLLDFGIAKFAAVPDVSAITRSGEIIGSPLYMAPEQAKGEADVDARADVWSVGAMLFEMLTGACAHVATSPVAVLMRILTEPAPSPSSKNPLVPSELDAIVQRAMTIDRDERFPSARAMYEALHELRTRSGTADTLPSLPPPLPLAVAPPNDHTPAAIASTILDTSAAPSTAPRAVNDDVATATPPRSILKALAVLGVIGGVGGIWVWGRPSPQPVTMPTVSLTAPEPTSGSSALASSTPTPHKTEPLTSSSAPTPAPPSAAPSGVVAQPPTTATTAPPVKCAATEVLSKGHCCARGLEWQGTRCERPLATTF